MLLKFVNVACFTFGNKFGRNRILLLFGHLSKQKHFFPNIQTKAQSKKKKQNKNL